MNSSFSTVADQVILFNKNIVEGLSKIHSLMSTNESFVEMKAYDDLGNLKTYTFPSFSSLKADIERLNQSIQSLYSIDSAGSLIATSNDNKFKKIITVDLNRDPRPISTIGLISNFKTRPNWFFDNMLDPMINIEIDLDGKVENNVRKVLSRRYILDFQKNSDGSLTPLGQSALISFNQQFKDNSNIILSEFEAWHRSTPGVYNPNNPRYDEDIYDFSPNSTMYDGEFTVMRQQEDRLNRRLWYVLNTLDYLVIDSGEVKRLNIGDELIINLDKTSTRFRVIEVSTAESNPKIRVETIEGNQPIPVGINTLKIYSPVIYNKKVNISIGIGEYNVVFVKPINTDNNIMSRKWSAGSGFHTNDLLYASEGEANGLSLAQFNIDYVYDYGKVLQDLVAKKLPNSIGITPNIPILNLDNFRVVQINKHLTDTPDANLIKQKHNTQLSLKSEVEQLSEAIASRHKVAKFAKNTSDSAKRKAESELQELITKKDSKSKLLASVTQEIITLSRDPKNKVEAKYRIRGFWDIPNAVSMQGIKPQEVVQFKVQYRYISSNGNEVPTETYRLDGNKTKASFSNWVEIKTDARKRSYNNVTGEYTWEIEDVSDSDTPNINQIDIPIQSNEQVEIRIKAISEVGWPESPMESEWSEVIAVTFPEDMNNISNDAEFILESATKEDLKVSMRAELNAKGLDTHLEDAITVNDVTYHHTADKILSGMTDTNGNSVDLLSYIKMLTDRITSLEEKISRAKGELRISILRNNQETIIKTDTETTFNVECEDYLTQYTGQGVNGRVYENNVYVIKDFVLKITNTAKDTNLGLLSNRSYLQNQDRFYNSQAPQVFWVNNQDELLTSDAISGQTRTQIDNQFLWMMNYDSITQDTVSKISENIGNGFVNPSVNSNSITNVLSTNDYNIGYNENGILNFIGNNKSLLDPTKWLDDVISIASTTKFLTTIHPVVRELEYIQENNSDKIKSVAPGEENSIIIPINIYFKLNALDTNQTGINNQYVDLNNSSKTVKHVKKLKFFLENESENRPFTFTLKFNLNRNKVTVRKFNNVGTPQFADDWSSKKK